MLSILQCYHAQALEWDFNTHLDYMPYTCQLAYSNNLANCCHVWIFASSSASSDCSPFPDIPFRVFNTFIQENFSSGISLTTVLTILFTLTNNPDLLNLHARQ